MESVAALMARIGEINSLVAPRVAKAPGGAPSATSVSFADALAQAQSTTQAAGSGRSVSGPAGSGSAGSVQQIKATWPNGRVPEAQLVPVGGGHRLAAPAAAAFADLQQAARSAGVSFGVTDSYRSLDQQVDLVRRKGLYSEGGLAARPGTSQHGWGLAVDLSLDARAQDWMRANGPRFGFVEDVPREPWHWTFRGR